MAAENKDRLLALLLFATLIALAVSGWRPFDSATWLLEVAPVLIALPVSALLVVAVRRLRAAYLASPLYRG